MILRTEYEQLFLILIPVRAETAEDGGSIVKSVRQYADLDVGIRYDTASKEHVFWQCHGVTPRILKSRGQSTTVTGSTFGTASTCQDRNVTTATTSAAK